jgi:hypothetical protein
VRSEVVTYRRARYRRAQSEGGCRFKQRNTSAALEPPDPHSQPLPRRAGCGMYARPKQVKTGFSPIVQFLSFLVQFLYCSAEDRKLQ